ncbi:MAG: hypothetical protein D4R76_06410 [Methylococcus sp.]|nr:MAG: hypothetical protein D4R76_06410 [Methylococcus sp.]
MDRVHLWPCAKLFAVADRRRFLMMVLRRGVVVIMKECLRFIRSGKDAASIQGGHVRLND